MSYRLIDANALATMPCIYVDLPNGLDGEFYDMAENNNTRWHELFGTPERAAQTLRTLIEDGPFLVYEGSDSFRSASACDLLDELCGGCGKCPSCVNVHETEYSIKFECNGGDYDALLEWLKQEVDS